MNCWADVVLIVFFVNVIVTGDPACQSDAAASETPIGTGFASAPSGIASAVADAIRVECTFTRPWNGFGGVS